MWKVTTQIEIETFNEALAIAVADMARVSSNFVVERTRFDGRGEAWLVYVSGGSAVNHILKEYI